MLLALPAIAARFCEAAEAIYQRVFLEQFQDYEERYGKGLLKINDARKVALISAIKSYMLYSFFRYVEAACSIPEIPEGITLSLQNEMRRGNRPDTPPLRKGVLSFMDYVNYQNPHFEDARMAPPFRFGNDIGEIMEQFDRPFLFMASQQGMMISKITETLAGEHTDSVVASKSTDTANSTATDGSRSSGVAVATGVATFGWWFAWGVFSCIMVLIVAQGGGVSGATQIFVVLGVGVLSGTAALFFYTRKRLKEGRGTSSRSSNRYQ